jgi:hypothetical protein
MTMNDSQNPFESTAIAQRNSAMTARTAETAASAVAAQATAMVNARYGMAMRNPRNMDQVRQDLLKECRRPSFANNKSALYNKPIGKGVEGLGIRFVEVALRCFRNTLNESTMVFADEEREIHRVSITDLESNTTWPMDVTVTRTVERSKPSDDGSYISMRLNSYGKKVYTVVATDDDLLNKRGALISKAIRTLGLRVIPGDLQDEAEDTIRAVRLNSAAQDPDAERRRLADAFAGLGVSPTALHEYLGHGLDACTPAELVDLRGLYGALRDGEATWAEALDNKNSQRDQAPATNEKPSPKAKRGVDGLKAAAAKRADDLPKTEHAGVESANRYDPITGIRHPVERGIDVDQQTGEVAPLLSDVERICSSALDIADSQTAFLRLDDARILLPEMSDENRKLAIEKIDGAVAALKAKFTV